VLIGIYALSISEMTYPKDVNDSYVTRFLSHNLKLILAITAGAIIFGIFLFFVAE